MGELRMRSRIVHAASSAVTRLRTLVLVALLLAPAAPAAQVSYHDAYVIRMVEATEQSSVAPLNRFGDCLGEGGCKVVPYKTQSFTPQVGYAVYYLLVAVQPTKANGKDWDGGSMLYDTITGHKASWPDIDICITAPDRPTHCASRSREDPYCRNDFVCMYEALELKPNTSVRVQIYDRDEKYDDLIGEGVCVVKNYGSEGFCTVGQAFVNLSQLTDANIPEPPDLTQIFGIDSMAAIGSDACYNHIEIMASQMQTNGAIDFGLGYVTFGGVSIEDVKNAEAMLKKLGVPTTSEAVAKSLIRRYSKRGAAVLDAGDKAQGWLGKAKDFLSPPVGDDIGDFPDVNFLQSDVRYWGDGEWARFNELMLHPKTRSAARAAGGAKGWQANLCQSEPCGLCRMVDANLAMPVE